MGRLARRLGGHGRRGRRIGRITALGCALTAVGVFAPCAAQAAVPLTSEEGEVCVLHSLPSFVDQGLGADAQTVADVVEVGCEPQYAGSKVTLSSNELYARCDKRLGWSAPYPYVRTSGRTFSLKLDQNGNARAVLWGGPGCASGESLIVVQLEAGMHPTAETSFDILPPQETEAGATALPASEPLGGPHASAATIIQIELPSVYAEEHVTVTAPALFRRCRAAPHLVWVSQTGAVLASGRESVTKLELDNNGNAFVVALAGGSCATGESELLATLEEAPFTQYLTSFKIVPPAG